MGFRNIQEKLEKILNLICIVVQTYMTNTQIGRYYIPNFVGVPVPMYYVSRYIGISLLVTSFIFHAIKVRIF